MIVLKNGIKINSRKLSKNGGFTLIELMVVVAIITILAVIAIPQYNRFMGKARQAEAGKHLGELVKLNKAFQLEYMGYTNALSALGLRPEGDVRYVVGWNNAVNSPPNYETIRGAPIPSDAPVNSVALCSATGATCRILTGADGEDPAADWLTGSAISNTAFNAVASACILASSGTCTRDEWEINENNRLTNRQSGLGD